MADDDLARELPGFAEDRVHVVVDPLQDIVGERGSAIVRIGPVADGLRAIRPEAEFRDHSPRETARTLEVIGGPGADLFLPADRLFGHPSSQQDRQVGQEALARGGEAILFGHLRQHPERVSAAEDGDLVDAVRVLEVVGDDGVAGFVDRDLATFASIHLPRRADAQDRLVAGDVEIGFRDLSAVFPRGMDRRLVQEVRELRAGEPGGGLRHVCEVHVRPEGDLAVRGDRSEDGEASVDVGQGHRDLAVEPARAHHGGIEGLGPVGGRDDHDAARRVEAVHLGQELVERLLVFAVSAARPLAAGLGEPVDLVDEEGAWRLGAGLFEQVADARRAHAGEYLDEFRSGRREERYAGFPGHGPCEQGLAVAGRPGQEDALGRDRAQFLEPRRVLEVENEFFRFPFRFRGAADVREGDALVRVDVGGVSFVLSVPELPIEES